jgi:Na+/H+ antiporter NhaD/arsenite permease-like protein
MLESVMDILPRRRSLSRPSLLLPLLGLVLAVSPSAAQAAEGLDGAAMSWPWALPFAGLLLSIATGPLLFPKVWHHHYGTIACAWAALAIVPLAVRFGGHAAGSAFVHAMLADYLSFIVLIATLYVVAGGILVTGALRGTPASNAALLAIGTVLASLVGTTGAAMILIRPLLRANENRQHNAHVVVFFIFLVANMGGTLSPLGDPPLFVGFLRGVDFFWTVQHLWLQTLIATSIVLAIFVVLDAWLYRREPVAPRLEPAGTRLRLRGGVNVLLIVAVIASILLSAMWKPGWSITVWGTTIEAQNLTRDITLILIALLSLWLTPNEHRAANGFTWEPIREVAILFAGIFTAIVPVLAMLHAGRNGLFAPLLRLITEPDGTPHEVAYFWLTGSLSAFLDNAPTYLVFFELAGGDAKALMGPLSGTLAGISLGAVFMGALTYVGNAPNFMVYAIATERGVRMPSFFGYFLWALLVLVPIFVLLTVLPIAPVLRAS